jgi:pseudouridine kinase
VDRKDHLGEPVNRISPIHILCIGGAVVDRSYECDDPPVTGRSNPVRGRTSLGGVARNVAEMLVKLGAQVKLASVVGEDRHGQELLAQAEASGIDVSLVSRVRGSRTAEYIGVFHKGELFAAVADMEIFERLDQSFAEDVLHNAEQIAGVFADCNLSTSALQILQQYCDNLNMPLATDTVSPAKAKRLGRRLSGISQLFTNRDEAQAMSGEKEPGAAIGILRNYGAASVVMGDGPAGVYAGDENGFFHRAMPGAQVINVSGAGDALAAGTFLRQLEGASLREAVIFGMGCAHAALEWASAVPNAFDRKEAERRSGLIGDAAVC